MPDDPKLFPLEELIRLLRRELVFVRKAELMLTQLLQVSCLTLPAARSFPPRAPINILRSFMLPGGKATFPPADSGLLFNPNSLQRYTRQCDSYSEASLLCIQSILFYFFSAALVLWFVMAPAQPVLTAVQHPAPFGFPFDYKTSEVCLCRRTPCREQHVSLPTPSKNESVPNCVSVPEWHVSIIPKQNAAKLNRNWQLQGTRGEKKLISKGYLDI